MKNVLSKVGLDVHKEKVLLALITPPIVSALHGVLENGVDLHVNERQKIRHYHARSTEERRREIAIF